MIRRVIKNILIGVFNGVVSFLVFIVLLPLLISRALNFPVTLNPLIVTYILGVFVALSVISSSVKPCIGVVFDVILSLISLLFILHVMEAGVFKVSLEIGERTVEALFDFRSLLSALVGFSVVITTIRVFEKITRAEEE